MYYAQRNHESKPAGGTPAPNAAPNTEWGEKKETQDPALALITMTPDLDRPSRLLAMQVFIKPVTVTVTINKSICTYVL